MNIYLLAGAILLTLWSAIYGELSHNDQEFISRYALPTQIASILDEHTAELIQKIDGMVSRGEEKHGVWTFRWLPGYYVKYNLDRLKGRAKMERCIKKYHLDLITLSDKYLYHVPGQPEELKNAHYLVIVKKIRKNPKAQPLSEEHVRQLCTIIEKTGYISMSRSNYIQTLDNKVALIDTESTFDSAATTKGLIRLIAWDHNGLKDYDKKGFEYILRTIAKKLECRICAQGHTHADVMGLLLKLRGRNARGYAEFFKSLIGKVKPA